VRIRITRARQGEIDGLDLATFRVGAIYEVAPSVATYLTTTHSAEFVDSEAPAAVVSVSETRISAIVEKVRAVAADTGRADDHEPPLSPKPPEM
jgi:hypothetical protein